MFRSVSKSGPAPNPKDGAKRASPIGKFQSPPAASQTSGASVGQSGSLTKSSGGGGKK